MNMQINGRISLTTKDMDWYVLIILNNRTILLKILVQSQFSHTNIHIKIYSIKLAMLNVNMSFYIVFIIAIKFNTLS